MCYLSTDEKKQRRLYYQLVRFSHNHYRKGCYTLLELPKRDGGIRPVLAPSKPLKRVQRMLIPLLSYGSLSESATAYRQGSATVQNALPHVGRPLLVKLDIRNFFGSIRFSQVFTAVDHALSASPSVGRHELNAYDRMSWDSRHYNQVLSFYFTQFCTLDGVLAQGAPTSPLLSNLVFYPIDLRIEAYCKKRGIRYTRYSDDMAFSGSFHPHALLSFVEKLLMENGFQLNMDKAAVLGKGDCRKVTGIVVNEAPHVDTAYRKKLRQTVHYIGKYGVRDHLAYIGHGGAGQEAVLSYLRRLQGQVSYVLQVQPDSQEFQRYQKLCQSWIRREEGIPS